MKKFVLSIVSLAVATATIAQSEPLLSEMVEGSGHDKGFEIFNPSDAPINLSQYTIKRYKNGLLTDAGNTFQMANVELAPGAVWVVINGKMDDSPTDPATSQVLQGLADELTHGTYPDPAYLNGNDAITIEKNIGTDSDPEWLIVDIFGKIGDNPGDDYGWGEYQNSQGFNRWWTRDHTLIRKPSIRYGVSANPAEFDPQLEWDSLPKDTWDSLRSHTYDFVLGNYEAAQRISEVYMYPNPSDGGIAIKATYAIEAVRFYNLAGQQVYTSQNAFSGMTVNLEDQPAGMYIGMIELRNGEVLTRKISLR